MSTQGDGEPKTLPDPFIRHLNDFYRSGKMHRWHGALAEDFEAVVNATNKLLSTASRITGLDQDGLIRATDFDARDLSPDRLDSAVAELRAVVHLDREGFKDIKLQRRQAGAKTPDVTATRNHVKYTLDVACASAETTRTLEDLDTYMRDVCIQKNPQFRGARANDPATRVGVIFVLNSDPALTFGYQPVFLAVVKQVIEALSHPQSYHIALLTGHVTTVIGRGEYFEGPDDVVYPPWEL
jgi:hypothetical protein